MYNIRSFYNLSDMTIEKLDGHFAPPLYTRRSAGHATQRAAPEQQLSVLDVAFAHVVRRLEGEIVFGFVPGGDYRRRNRQNQQLLRVGRRSRG